ncbi:probable methyltransferase PMT23 [Oryza brachyantha]|uniref:Methyltransferase n=1 Tax=Oryza brachyantha TaxID=4533 RepID=J3L5F6_ORYBR|nr:probable methyltransferase PMT23 [Oryza brachyantha]
MAISSALSFLSDRKRPVVVSVFLFLLLSSLFLLFSPAPAALPFFSSPSSHLSSSSSSSSSPSTVAASPPQTPISVPADASPPENPVNASGGSNAGATAGPPHLGLAAPTRDISAYAPRPDRSTPVAAVEVGGSADANGTSRGASAGGDGAAGAAMPSWEACEVGMGVVAADYIPCLDNVKAVKALKSLRHMEHRERHCPTAPRPRCLVPLPLGYRSPLPWPRSRDMIWYNNVPHPKLVEYKKDQNWVRKSGNYFVFPGGGTQFKAGATRYIQFIEQIMPNIQWGTHTRTVLDVGCGVASFGGYLLDRNVITMSFAPKDEHEAQIQFALERGIPALLAVIGTQKLPFPDNSFDVIHCARCRVHWYADGGKPLLELNRVLRPGGYYIWSATPVYRRGKRDEDDWNAMVVLTKSICWRTVVKSKNVNKIGVVIYQKPTSNSCYLERKNNEPPLCSGWEGSHSPWYAPLDSCLSLPAVSSSGEGSSWPISWPERLNIKYSTTSDNSSSQFSQEEFDSDTKHWKDLVSEVYFSEFAINWSTVRNVMDMNAGFGGFAASLIHQPLWVMNVVPFDHPDTLPIIFNRGLIGVYHDWCESFNTYPRTYDLVHMSYLLQGLTNRCDITEVAAEIDRILRPGKWFVLQDTEQVIGKMDPVLRSLHYKTAIVKQQFLVASKGFWRPDSAGSESR